MDNNERKALRALVVFLKENIYLGSMLLDHLLSYGTITDSDYQRIKCESCEADKIGNLLDILRVKGNDPWKKFIDSLKETSQIHVVNKLERELQIQQGIENCIELYELNEGQLLAKSEFIHSLGNTSFGDEEINRILESLHAKIFMNMDEEQPTIYNIQYKTVTSNDTRNTEVNTKMEDWTNEDVVRWLRSFKRPISECAINIIQEIELNGEMLEDLCIGEIDKAFPGISYVVGKQILKERDKFKRDGDESDVGLPFCDIAKLHETEPTDRAQGHNILVTEETFQCELKGKVGEDSSTVAATPIKNTRKEMSLSSNASSDLRFSLAADSVTHTKQRLVSSVTESTETLPKENLETATSSGNSESNTPHETQYQLGDIIPNHDINHSDLLTHITVFEELHILQDESVSNFVLKSIAFIAGCLNERQNGICFFGVSGSHHKHVKLGEITGVQIVGNIETYMSIFDKRVHSAFMQDQVDIIQQCYRLKFLPLLNPFNKETRHVIKVVVSPSYQICKQGAFFVRMPKDGTNLELEDPVLCSIRHTEPIKMTSESLSNFMENKKTLSDRRRREEHNSELSKDVDAGLTEKLRNLLCEDDNKIPKGIYHVLVLGPATTQCKEDLAFIGAVNWQVVFDFDPSGTVNSYFDNTSIHKRYIRIFEDTSDFTASSKKNIDNPDRIKKVQEEIRQSHFCPWIFCNGCNNQSATFNVENWVRNVRQSWKETLQFFKNEMGEPRVKIVFLLMSSDNDVMVEAAEDLFVTFRESAICLSDNVQHVQTWRDELLRRKRISETEMDDMCVLGIDWKATNKIILDAVDRSELQTQCYLPTASGKFIQLLDALRSSWYDLCIISSTECDDKNMDPQEKADLSHKKEDLFYKGYEVDWWNFKFVDHVMQREVYPKIKRNIVQEIRKQNCDIQKYVSRIVITHQPGAGGTTLGKHLLWSFRKIYRCAVISTCADPIVTKEQIFQFRSASETGLPNPVLLLLDNIDDEKVALLMAEIEEAAKHINRAYDGTSERSMPIVCVLIHLVRAVEIPTGSQRSQYNLTHKLAPGEMDWLKKKYTQLENNFVINKSRIDPKLLISFNIMKSGFNLDYVKELTEKLLEAVSNTKERLLLKYVSAINAYDLSFRELPSAAFDVMMTNRIYVPGPRRGKHATSQRWESQLSTAVLTLINENPEFKSSIASIHSIRISNEILAKVVFETLKAEKNQNTTDVYKELLGTREIFNVTCAPRDRLLWITVDVMKKRNRDEKGSQKKFSPLVMDMKDKEGVDSCVAVLEIAYKQSQDLFLAQQIARVYIESENWDNAVRYGEELVAKAPGKSFLWDTYARVYLTRLIAKHKSLIADTGPVNPSEIIEIIKLARRAIEKFQNVQSTSLDEANSYQQENNAGLFGELSTIKTLADCLQSTRCLESFQMNREKLHLFLIEDFTPESMTYLSICDAPDDHLKFLKSLKDRAAFCLCKLEDESSQRKENTYTETQNLALRQQTTYLKKLGIQLSNTFGEFEYDSGPEVQEEVKCRNRRRQIARLSGGYSPMCILELVDKAVLSKILDLASINVNSQCLGEDILTFITVTIARSTLDLLQGYEYYFPNDICDISVKLYEKRNTLCPWNATGNSVFLEPYLYYVMFNWPRRSEPLKRILPMELKKALKEWKDAYYTKFPQQKHSRNTLFKRETTYFFLADGTGLNGFRTHRQLKKNLQEDRESLASLSFWRNPTTIKELERFTGKLVNDGQDVQISVIYGSGNKDYITIPASFPVRNRSLWNKTVYFVIGFSWKSPKAYDITLNDPGLDDKYVNVDSGDVRSDGGARSEHLEKELPETHNKDTRRKSKISKRQKKGPT